MRASTKLFSAVLALALVVGVNVSTASAQSSFYDPNAGVPATAAPPAAPVGADEYAPAGVVQDVPDGEQLPPPSAVPGYTPAPIYAGLPGCPVAPYDMQRVLSGYYGVDALYRPLNAFGFPVDIYGRCLTYAPVTMVYNAAPSPLYIGWLSWRWHYAYFYRPGFVHLYGGPGVAVYGGGVFVRTIPYGATVGISRTYRPPVGTVINNHTTINAGGRVTVTPGGAPMQSARPGATINNNTTIINRGAAPQTARPGGVAAPSVAAPPQSVAPPRAITSTPGLSRPGAGVAAPSQSVAPPRAAPSVASPGLSRPAPSISAPYRAPTQSIAPPRPSFSSPGLSRPSGGGFSGGSRPSFGGGGRRR